jgi:hypothetical protein
VLGQLEWPRIIWLHFGGTPLVARVGVGLAAFGMSNTLFATFIQITSEQAVLLKPARLLLAASWR